MKFLVVLCIFAFVVASIVATPVESNDPDHVEEAPETEPIAPFGFGCPLDQQKCHLHCISIGRRGGYCAGTLKLTCTCYAN